MGKLRRTLTDESGISLVIAILVLAAVLIIGTSVVAYSSANTRGAEYSAESVGAVYLAEAGESYARSILWNASDTEDPNAVASGSVSLKGGTASYSGTYDSETQTWTLTGTGSSANPTGAAAISRTVSSQVLVVTNLADPAWGYTFADSLTACSELKGDAVLSTPAYIRGDLCMSNDAQFTGSTLHVGGNLTTAGLSSVGSAVSPIQSANIVGGCNGGPCGPATNVYADSISQDPGTLTKPVVDLAYWRLNASPGPNNPCTLGSFPGGFSSDPDLTPPFAYTCRTATGELSWTPGIPGTLTIAGAIFFDGDLLLDNGADVVYQGQATIYISGSIEIKSNARLCGVAACDASWDSSVNNLLLVAGWVRRV